MVNPWKRYDSSWEIDSLSVSHRFPDESEDRPRGRDSFCGTPIKILRWVHRILMRVSNLLRKTLCLTAEKLLPDSSEVLVFGIQRAVTKDLTSSSKFYGSCGLTFQTTLQRLIGKETTYQTLRFFPPIFRVHLKEVLWVDLKIGCEFQTNGLWVDKKERLTVDSRIAHSLSSTKSQGTSNIPFPSWLLGSNRQIWNENEVDRNLAVIKNLPSLIPRDLMAVGSLPSSGFYRLPFNL